MLSDLKAIHTELRDAIAVLESVVSYPAPDDTTLSAARLQLTRLSRRRRAMIDAAILQLHDLAPYDAQQVADLRRETGALMVQSSQHIGAWTMRAIVADWSGYQRASAEMRRDMLRRIQREATVLYPLLEERAPRKAA